MAICGHHQSEKDRSCEDYIRALEEERTKIQAFQRELPLCLELVTQAIESCKQRLTVTNECNLQSEGSEGSEQTSSRVAVLEEFVCIPMVIKRALSNSDSGCEEHDFKKPKIDDISVTDKDRETGCSNNKKSAKSDWLRSVQLWNQPSKEDDSTKTVGVKSGGAFHPFKKEKKADIEPPTSTKKEEEDRAFRKSRRCWSPQLHKRFLEALHELGGSHVATPKQIRDLMKVEGLTNDEVKSHLQKYRLHERRPTPSSQNITAASTQATQFVVVTGGLWMPTATNTTSNGIYAPVASLPLPFQETSESLTRSGNNNVEN